MRDFRLVEIKSKLGEDIKTILEYLALSPNHFITYAMVDPYGKVLSTTDIRMKDNGSFFKVIYIGGEEVTRTNSDLTINEISSAIDFLKKQNPSSEYADTFSSKWDEVVKVTELNVGANRLHRS